MNRKNIMSLNTAFLIDSLTCNALNIRNKFGENVMMNMETSKNNFSINLENSNILFKSDLLSKIIYTNLDLNINNIAVNNITNYENNNIQLSGNVDITNGFLTHENNKVLVLDTNNKIPISCFSNLDIDIIKHPNRISFLSNSKFGVGIKNPHEKLHIKDGNFLIENGSIFINTINKDAILIIKHDLPNRDNCTVKFENSSNIGTIKFYAQHPYMSICSSNIDIVNNNIQLFVEKNIQCNDIVFNNKSLDIFHNEFIEYITNTNLKKLTTESNILKYDGDVVILEKNIMNIRNIDNLEFTSDKKIIIDKILCSENNTYILSDFKLYKLLNNNTYCYIDDAIDEIKIENGALIYKKGLNINFIFDNLTSFSFFNVLTAGYNDNYMYIKYNDDTTIYKTDINNNITTVVNLNELIIKEIYCTINYIYIKDHYNNIHLYDINESINLLLLSNVCDFYLGYSDSYYYNKITDKKTYYKNNNILYSNIDFIFINTFNENIYLLKDNIIYINNINNYIMENITTCGISSRHMVLYDKFSGVLYTKTFEINTGFNGLGRNNITMLHEKNNNILTKIGIPFLDVMKIYPSLNIGSSLNFFENNIENSLCVESCIGIGCKPLKDFALRLKGDILIEDGNIYKNSNKSDIFSNISTPLSLEDYVKRSDLNIKLNSFKDEMDRSIHSNLYNDISNLDNIVSNLNINPVMENSCNLWKHNIEYDSIHILNSQVSINTKLNLNMLFGNNKIPSLYVGDGGFISGYKIQGIICENDIAAFSDERIKKDIVDIPNSLHKVLNMRGVNYKRTNIEDQKIYMGVLAQNVEQYCPEVVEEFNGIKTVAYGNLTGVLIEAIKEMYEMIKNVK